LSYNTAIPQSSDARAQSQKQILANFQAIARVWADNHYPLNGTDNEFYGMHTVLTMRPQIDHPETDIGQIALYNKLVGGIPELFFMPQNQHIPTQKPIQLTYPSISTGSGGTQYSFVAGPFIVYMGFIQNVAGVPNGQVITLMPGNTLLYAGLTSAGVKGTDGGTGIISPLTLTASFATNLNSPANSFTITHGLNGINGFMQVVYYLAIGV